MSDDLQQIHQDAIIAFDNIWVTMNPERKLCVADRRFYSIAGAQWEGLWEDLFADNPKMEVNKIHASIIDIIIEYRNNRVSVDFRPNDRNEDADFAEVLNGKYRACESESVAQEAYDNAFEEAAAGGFGAWRYTNEYVDEDDPDNEQQEIYIEPIYDADTSVYFDLNAKRQDKSDANYAFVLKTYTKAAFAEEWPDHAASSMPNTPDLTCTFDWFQPSLVYVAEYYVKEYKNVLTSTFENTLTGETKKVRDSETDEIEQLLLTGWKFVRRRKIKTTKIHKYIISGAEILEDCGYIAGKYIPIVPVYGKRWFVDNIERCQGAVRLTKDSQRLYNMVVSQVAEIAASSPKRIPIWTPEQIKGHETRWADQSVNRYPYLTVNAMTNADGSKSPAPPVGYIEPMDIPSPLAALMEVNNRDLADLTGKDPNAEQLVSNISAKAIELVQTRIDRRSFIYLDNFKKAMQAGGRIWLSMAKEIYCEDDRKVKVIDAQGSMSIETLNTLGMEGEQDKILNNMDEADFDVVADVGPSFMSRRDGTVRALVGMMQFVQDPDLLNTLMSVAIMNMDGEGIDDLQKYFRRMLIRRGIVQPTDEEKQEMEQEAAQQAQQPPSAQDQYLLAAAEESKGRALKAGADAHAAIARASTAEADAAKAVAETERTKAETARIWASMDDAAKDRFLKAFELALKQGEQVAA